MLVKIIIFSLQCRTLAILPPSYMHELFATHKRLVMRVNPAVMSQHTKLLGRINHLFHKRCTTEYVDFHTDNVLRGPESNRGLEVMRTDYNFRCFPQKSLFWRICGLDYTFTNIVFDIFDSRCLPASLYTFPTQ